MARRLEPARRLLQAPGPPLPPAPLRHSSPRPARHQSLPAPAARALTRPLSRPWAQPRRPGPGAFRSSASLFGGLEQHRAAGAQLLEQSRLVGLGGREMTLLDVSKAADFFRYGRQSDRDRMVLRRERPDDFVEHRLVIGNQLALGAALQGAAERIEWRAAQTLELREQAEHRQYPRPEVHLARQPGRLVAARKQRRRQMKLVAQIVAAEFGFDLLLEGAVGVEPRHLVLVLVGHELEQVTRHRVGQPAFA